MLKNVVDFLSYIIAFPDIECSKKPGQHSISNDISLLRCSGEDTKVKWQVWLSHETTCALRTHGRVKLEYFIPWLLNSITCVLTMLWSKWKTSLYNHLTSSHVLPCWKRLARSASISKLPNIWASVVYASWENENYYGMRAVLGSRGGSDVHGFADMMEPKIVGCVVCSRCGSLGSGEGFCFVVVSIGAFLPDSNTGYVFLIFFPSPTSILLS